MPDSDVGIAYGFFCEQVRPELAGRVTAIGLWGEVCRLAAAPPVALPGLALHAYVRNPRQVPFEAVFHLELPGVAEPEVFRFPVATAQGAVGNNININLANPPMLQAGTVRARLVLTVDPPIEREFTLEIQFVPPGTTSPAGV